MATITKPDLEFVSSDSADLAVFTLTYTVTFDRFDRASDQPYTEVLRVMGDDTNVGDPASAAPDDLLHELFMENPIRASMAGSSSTLVRDHKRAVPIGKLNEDKAPLSDSDEIMVVVTLTPDPPKAVGPTESDRVTLNL